MEENQIQIPEGWAKQKGDNLFKVQGGYAFKSSDYKDEGVLLVRISNVGNNNFIYKDLIYVPKRFLTSHSNYLLNKDDVLMGLTGDLGKICILENGEFPFILNQRVGRFIFNEKVNNRFLYYLISSSTIQNKFDAFFTGGAQKNISPKQIESVEYVVPKSTTEQTTIADILSKTDQAIANTEALIAKYTHIKTGLMQDLFTKGIDENGNIRSEQTHEFKDSPLGRIPKEWGVVSLKQIGTKNGPYLKTGPFGSSLKGEHWKETGVPVITIGSLGEGIFLKKNLLYVSNDKAFELLSYQLIEGDILFSRVAEIGRSLVIKTENAGWIMSSNFMRLRLDSSTYLPDFLNIVIKYSQSFQKQVSENVNESGRSVTNSKILNSFLFPKVSIKEQNTILEKMKSLNKSIKLFETELSKLQSLKTGLMQDLLSGKVRVNNLMKEKQN